MNISKKEGCLSDEEYFTRVVNAITEGIIKVEEETNEMNTEATIKALQNILQHQIRIDTESEIISYILEKTNNHENISHRITNRNHNYCKNKNCEYHVI